MPNYYKSDTGFVTTIPGAVTVTDLTVSDDLVVTDDFSADAATVTSLNGIQFLAGSAVPTAGAGVAATAPAFYMRTGTNQVWIKSGAGDTAWVTASHEMLANNGFSYFSGATPGIVGTINGGEMDFGGAVCDRAVISPAAIGTTQATYSPAGLISCNVLRQDVSAACTIQSLLATLSGHIIKIWNIATNPAFTLTLLHDDGASGTASGRILCPANTSLVIPANGTAYVEYDITTGRWRASRGY